jgi:bilirubin oxidase
MNEESMKKLIYAAVSFVMLAVLVSPAQAAPLPGGSIDPTSIPKYTQELTIPAAMVPVQQNANSSTYNIAARQVQQQVLPAPLPKTTIWGYGNAQNKGVASWPANTIETPANNKVDVTWINQLVDSKGKFLPPLLPIDQTLHWANPPGPVDSTGTSQTPYTGPVPIVTHLHGAHVPSISDGNPEAWYLPAANNIPAGYFTKGPDYDSVKPAATGSAVYEYPNDQRATTLWYHDHVLGITRTNVYSGLAGFYLIRDSQEASLNLPGPAPKVGDKSGTKYYEIPLMIQDRSFNSDGSLFYPDSRTFFDGFGGPYSPATDIPPMWNPEFFGNTMTVNGKTWPSLDVEPRLYRLRLVNGSDSRTIILKLVTNPTAKRPAKAAVPFYVIGSDGGLLPGSPAVVDQLLMMPAERYDVIVDLSKLKADSKLYLINEGPDEPFGGGVVGTDFDASDPGTTGQVMQLKVVPLTNQGIRGQIPVTLPSIPSLGTAVKDRDVTLNEHSSSVVDVNGNPLLPGAEPAGPSIGLLGSGRDGALMFDDPVTENPKVNTTENWRIINLTEDAHPIHVHLVQFQVIDRTPFNAEAYQAAQDAYIAGGKVGAPPDPYSFATGPALGAETWEAGRKDTVVAYPGWITKITARFDIIGNYIWHCHILSHEDNEMMRPYQVVP